MYFLKSCSWLALAVKKKEGKKERRKEGKKEAFERHSLDSFVVINRTVEHNLY